MFVLILFDFSRFTTELVPSLDRRLELAAEIQQSRNTPQRVQCIFYFLMTDTCSVKIL